MTVGALHGNLIAGSYPKDQAEKEKWKRMGKRPGSINIGLLTGKDEQWVHNSVTAVHCSNVNCRSRDKRGG